MEIQQAKDGCDAKIRKFNRLLRRYDPTPLDPDIIQEMKIDWSRELSIALDDLVESIENLSIKHGHDLGSEEVAVWKQKITDGEKNFRHFLNKVARKPGSVQNLSVPANVLIPGAAAPDQSHAANNAMADVKVDAEIVATEGTELADKVNKCVDWTNATNEEIEIAMTGLEGWELKFAKIRERSYAVKRNTIKFNLDDTELRRAEAIVGNLETDLELARDALISEDKNRCLFSLSKSNSAAVKFPHFSGNREEDFSKFRKEFEKVFETNRVRKEDQVKKLREFLRGDAKAIIPESMEVIATAWNILKNMYGDSSRVMDARKRMIKDMGLYPNNGKPLVKFKNQIEWITKLEVTLNDIKELANASEQMERDAYSSDMLNLILSYFPSAMQTDLQMKMEGLSDDGKLRLHRILDHIVIERRIAQGLLKTAEAKADLAPDADEGSGDHGDREGSDGELEGHDGQNLRRDLAGIDYDEDSAEDYSNKDCISDEEHRQEPGGAQDA